MSELSKLNTRAPLDRSPKTNWVENSGGLPMFIRRIANHVHAKGKSIGHSIAIAVNAVKKMCASGDTNFPGKQQVNGGSQAEACAAVAEWERKKAGARVSKGVVGRKWSDDEFIAYLTGETDVSKQFVVSKQGFDPSQKRGPLGTWVVAGSDVAGGKKRDKSFALPKGAKSGSWKRIKGTGDKNGYRDTKVGVFEMKDGTFSVFKKENGKMIKTGSYSDAASANARASRAVSNNTPKKKPLRQPIPRDGKIIAKISDEEFSELSKSVDVKTFDFDMVGEIEKVDKDKQLVFGWFSVAKHADGTVEVDKQGDVLEDIDQMEKVAYEFVLHSRDGGEMHVRKGVSTLVESFVSTPEKWEAMGIPEGTLPVGWWGGFKVNDAEVWKAVKSGKYKDFSVHGSGMRKSMEEA